MRAVDLPELVGRARPVALALGALVEGVLALVGRRGPYFFAVVFAVVFDVVLAGAAARFGATAGRRRTRAWL